MSFLNNNDRSFQDIVSGEKVGIIGNYITIQIISNSIELVEVFNDDIFDMIEKYGLSTVIIEKDIYEQDHPYFDSTFDVIVENLHQNNIKVFYLSSNISDNYNNNECDMFINVKGKTIEVSDNKLYFPFILDKNKFNPSNTNTYYEVLMYGASSGEVANQIKTYMSEEKLQLANPNYITRSFIKYFLKTIKRTNTLYFEDYNVPSLMCKMIEVSATLQNTQIIVNSERAYLYDFAYNLEKDQLINYFRFTFNNNDYINKLKVTNVRNAMLEYTEIDRNKLPKIGVIVVSMRKERLLRLFEDISKQRYVDLEVVLLTHGFSLTDIEVNKLSELGEFKLKVITADFESSLGMCLNKCLDYVESDYVIKMDDDDYYFPNFIIDIYIAHSYSQASIVGKFGFYFYLKSLDLVGMRRINKQYVNVSEVKGNGIFSETSLLKKYRFSDLSRHEDSDLFSRIRKDKGNIFCIHPYDMCVYRDVNKSNHSYQVEDANFLRDANTLYIGKPNETICTK